MKSRLILFILAIVMSVSLQGMAQTATYKQPVPEAAVPKALLATFKKQYPDARVIQWLTTHISYWYSDYDPGWYGPWYPNRVITVYSFSEPAYYEVVFETTPGETSRAIYNRYGFWYETRTQLKGLPLPVMEGLAQTKFGDWKRSVHKERIDIPGNPGPVYRLRVTKGIQSRIIRLDQKGNLIQVKKEMEE